MKIVIELPNEHYGKPMIATISVDYPDSLDGNKSNTRSNAVVSTNTSVGSASTPTPSLIDKVSDRIEHSNSGWMPNTKEAPVEMSSKLVESVAKTEDLPDISDRKPKLSPSLSSPKSF